MYDEHRQQGLEVLGIAFVQGDEKGRKWLRGYMKDKGLTWTNAPVAPQWYAPPFEPYNVQFLPFNLLLDREGKLVEVNPRTDELEEAVSKALGHVR